MFEVAGLDHIVLKVADVDASLSWYTEKLGLVAERVEEFRAGEVFFPSVRINAGTIIDLFGGGPDGTNLDHFCVVVEHAGLDAVAASGEFEVVDGPGARWGARGMATSLYVTDPDGNTVELRCYDD